MTAARHMRPARRRRRVRAVVLGVLIVVVPASGATGEENRAAARIEAMATFLARTQRLAVTVDCSYDVVQESGQKIELGETRKIVLRRPDHLRIDATKRDGSQSLLLFDGKDITVAHAQENVYATVAQAGLRGRGRGVFCPGP